MNDKTLTKISLISSFIGLILVYLATTIIQVKAYDISEIKESMVDRDAKIVGQIKNIVKTEKVLILLVKDNSGSITVISFDPEDIEDIKEGQIIEARGKIALYKNKLEIIADSIKTND